MRIILTGSLTAFLLSTVSVSAVFAADLGRRPPEYVPVMPALLPAVSGLNGSIEGGLGGQWGDEPHDDGAAAYLLGTVTIPIGQQWGAQVDGQIASSQGEFAGGLGGHLFWRDPSYALFGAYVEGFTTDVTRGRFSKSRIGPEVEFYLNRFTVSAVAGYEFGNRDIRDGFFADALLSYYSTDDLRLYLGGNYGFAGVQGKAGVEYQLPAGSGYSNVAMFAEARLGEEGYKAAFAGVKIALGAPDKSLIRRHREDDPIAWIKQNIHDVGQATAKGKFNPPSNPPTTSYYYYSTSS